LLLPILLEFLRDHPDKPRNSGLRAIWITPIRALSKEIEYSANRAIEAFDVPWQIGVRTGDTSLTKRTRQRVRPPEFLITTPESLHLLLASKGYAEYFQDLRTIVVDEWHELMGSKRGVQVELALSRLKTIAPLMKVWGISATIGNMDQAMEVLLGTDYKKKNTEIIRANIKKDMEIVSVLPDELERMPWSGTPGCSYGEKGYTDHQWQSQYTGLHQCAIWS
jgi:ATP-dependent Lhr-like helicase